MAVPEAVRTAAVGAWRKRHMATASKAARRRMSYARLCNEPSFRELEQRLLRRYWKSHAGLLQTDRVDAGVMTLAEACSTFRSLHPKLGMTSLDGLMHECLSEALGHADVRAVVCESLSALVLDKARTDDLSTLVRLRREDPPGSDRWRSHAFGLQGASSMDDVRGLVRHGHLVSAIIRHAYGQDTIAAAAQDLLSRHLSHDADVTALNGLLSALFGIDDPVGPSVSRMTRRAAAEVEDHLQGEEFAALVADALLENPLYALQYQRSVELKLRVRESVPETPMEAYPLARTMRRRFVVHVGPTNSGKTHDALQELMAAESGAYLGPLRLLAYEQFQRMNQEGTPCTMLTGEERIEVAGARHVSSTVEMADFHQAVDVAVIDEAQMVTDPDRGHNWTAAILGIPAREVHVCCAPHAERIVCDLVDLCEDECEVVRHERLVPLRAVRRRLRVPEDVRPGDALIVFSRRSVHAVAADVAASGLRASVVYGALPHDVRHEEARRFDEGETDVVVATDAIGMGMNLPIRRIVFVEQEKYDGRAMRTLLPGEVQQIAGRAGRFGRYEEGTFASTRRVREIARLYGESVPDIESIPVGIPNDIALVRDATLGESLRQWMAIEQPLPFVRIDVSRELGLLSEIEARLDEGRARDRDTKLRVLTLATMPFDERDRRLRDAWRQMVDVVLEGSEARLDVPKPPREGARLADLEADYHYCDLLYLFERSFGEQERMDLLTARREQISQAIMGVLAGGSVR